MSIRSATSVTRGVDAGGGRTIAVMASMAHARITARASMADVMVTVIMAGGIGIAGKRRPSRRRDKETGGLRPSPRARQVLQKNLRQCGAPSQTMMQTMSTLRPSFLLKRGSCEGLVLRFSETWTSATDDRAGTTPGVRELNWAAMPVASSRYQQLLLLFATRLPM